MMLHKNHSWDHIERFRHDPCGCPMCKRIQKVVMARTGIQLFMQASEKYLKDHNFGKKGAA